MPSPIRRQRRSIGEVASDWLGAATDVLNRGLVAGVVGAPVDIASTVLRPFVPGIGDAPVGGSEWIGNKMQQAGMVSSKRRPIAEFAASLIDPATAPAAIAKAASLGTAKLSMLPLAIGQTVWHGSPYKFDKFDSSKIGTGEGKQQQGVGSYLAEAQAVGQKYADKEAWKRGMDSGFLYKVDVPDDMIAKMANHDAPFSQQPENVKKAVQAMIGPDELAALRGYHGWERLDDAPFAAVMDSMETVRGNNRAATSAALRDAGIPGIRYLDGGSRGTGQGTSNFVVFPGNEGLLTILERNGVPIVPEPK